MSQTRFIHDGNSIDYTPPAHTTAGAVVVQGDLIGVTKVDIPAGALGALAVRGVFDFPKATTVGSGSTAGTRLYWDATNALATADDESGANKYLGKSIRAAGDTDPVVRIRLEQ